MHHFYGDLKLTSRIKDSPGIGTGTLAECMGGLKAILESS